jgi:hypothetical protein
MGLMVQGYNPVCTMSCFGPKIPAWVRCWRCVILTKSHGLTRLLCKV